MFKRLQIVGALSASIVFVFASSSVALAAPILYGQPVRPLGSTQHTSSTSTSKTTASSSATTATLESDTSNSNISTATGDVPEQLSQSQVRACGQHQNVITTIMDRADVRSLDQISLFSAIALNVENYYGNNTKTTATFGQLVTAVNTSQVQAYNDLTSLQGDTTFSCNGNNPSAIVSTYRAELTTMQAAILNLRTAVKNLILGVAQAEGYTLPSETTSGGQQP